MLPQPPPGGWGSGPARRASGAALSTYISGEKLRISDTSLMNALRPFWLVLGVQKRVPRDPQGLGNPSNISPSTGSKFANPKVSQGRRGT